MIHPQGPRGWAEVIDSKDDRLTGAQKELQLSAADK